jgi:plasmid stabilization system protein ParE
MRITWSSRAKKNVSEYGDYVAQDNPDAASDWIEGILDEVERLKDFPEQGRGFRKQSAPMFGKSFSRAIVLSIVLNRSALLY